MASPRKCFESVLSELPALTGLSSQRCFDVDAQLADDSSLQELPCFDVASLAVAVAERTTLPRLDAEGAWEHPGEEEHDARVSKRRSSLDGLQSLWGRYWEDVLGNSGYVVGAYLISFGYGIADKDALWQFWILAWGLFVGLCLALKNAVRISRDIRSVTEEDAIAQLVGEAVEDLRHRLSASTREKFSATSSGSRTPSSFLRMGMLDPAGRARVQLEKDVLHTLESALSEAERSVDVPSLAPCCCRSCCSIVTMAMLLFTPFVLATAFHGQVYWPTDGADFELGGAAPPRLAWDWIPLKEATDKRVALRQHSGTYPCGIHMCVGLGHSGRCQGKVYLGQKYYDGIGLPYTPLYRIKAGNAGPYAVLPELKEKDFKCALPASFPRSTMFDQHCVCESRQDVPLGIGVPDSSRLSTGSQAPPGVALSEPTYDVAQSRELRTTSGRPGQILVASEDAEPPTTTSLKQFLEGSDAIKAMTAGAVASEATPPIKEDEDYCSMVYQSMGVCASGFFAGYDGRYLSAATCKAACLKDDKCKGVSFCPPDKTVCAAGGQNGTCSRYSGHCHAASLDVGEDRFAAHRSYAKVCKARRLQDSAARPRTLFRLPATAPARTLSMSEENHLWRVGSGILWGNVALNFVIAFCASWPVVRWLANLTVASMEKELRAQLHCGLERYFASKGRSSRDCATMYF